ncbi:MAG: bifunctional phosphoribosyl-AMP cyclohydrolase/phosphoribosyl-ATP diphosphatase HisIE [Candidatus Thermoplasmatota archaeon]|nr:bifunctional phosphoribosyl-AMP cyclohydrolase/phosphoribosyl-ATP diphosphatase HisIE [Candidatus Thermoplasmatota archaeon]MDA8143300.1 bifunctional phosphoribosyl-AMP cyclohydrolase/phosphoribosyl-ATP diphosphatase HisIE [Thermoplasmatales archaeon]
MSESPDISNLRFADGLIPVVAVDDRTGAVITLAYMNEEALKLTISTGFAHYYSRSKGRIRMKGETSGNTQKIVKIFTDCDSDSVLIRVEQKGPGCHTGEFSCFHSELGKEGVKPAGLNYSLSVLRDLESVISQRKLSGGVDSYTKSLFNKGREEIYKKFGEEAVEVLVANSRDRTIYETADMFYHLLVLLSFNEIKLDDVMHELSRRRVSDE